MRTKVAALALAMVALLTTNVASQAKWKGCKNGGFQGCNQSMWRGSSRARAQHMVNAYHPTGRTRANMQHMVNASLPNGYRGMPPGQAKKLRWR